ncbi:MAG: ribosomal protein S18-alanine N-acetyltransferase [Mariprofundus sp.]
MASFTLRQGSIEDAEILYRLNKDAFAEYWSRQSLLSALQSGYDLLLCETDGKAVAYLLSLSIIDEIQILQIGVAKPYRRQGLARQMTQALMTNAVDCSSVTLEVRLSNQAARALYAGLGFEEVGYRKNYYAPDVTGVREDAVLMTRTISAVAP